jgi:hypothetical protein
MSELVAAGDGKGTAMEIAAPDGAVEAIEREVALLDEMAAVWRARALDGDPTAVDKVLEIQKQRLVLKQLWPAAPSQGVKVSAGAAARGDEREVRVVVEYVDDWRQAGKKSLD